MKKLRLIKPWQLRPVRQRLAFERAAEVHVIAWIPCSGPASDFAGNDSRSFTTTTSFERTAAPADDRSACRTRAPFSDGIFARTCNPRH